MTVKKGELLSTMLMLMVNGHAGQFDKGGAPYSLHPLAVMYLLQSADEELQCIALGHDLIEDTKLTYKALAEHGMTNRIIEGIRAMTRVPGQTEDEYQEGLFQNIDAMLVKKADLTHNTDVRRLKGVSEKDIARMVKYHTLYLKIENKLKGMSLEYI